MSAPELELTRDRVISRARLEIVLSAFSMVHYGIEGGGWGGNSVEGWYVYDKADGDMLAIAWDRSGLVALALAHESDRCTREREPPPDHSLTWLPELPTALHHLANTAVSFIESATAGMWIDDAGQSRRSDPIDANTSWADGAEMLVRFGMTAEEAVFGDTGQNWWELSSLSRAQAELAIRITELSERGRVVLSGSDAELVIANPDPDDAPGVTHDNAKEAREQLALVGIDWDIPHAKIDAILEAEEASRRASVEAAIGPEARKLLDAARGGDLEALREYIEAGADLETRTVDKQYEHTPPGDTPLIQALKNEHPACARLLIERGARQDSANAFNQTALHWAVRKGELEVTRLLLDRGASAVAPPDNGWTPLHTAAAEGFSELVDLLLEHGADPTAVHGGGLTPSEVADRRGHADLAARLRDRAG